MGRKKIDTNKFLEDRKKRRTAFRKRKDGALKKLKELSTLCGVDIFMAVLDEKGQLQRFTFSADPHNVIRRLGPHLLAGCTHPMQSAISVSPQQQQQLSPMMMMPSSSLSPYCASPPPQQQQPIVLHPIRAFDTSDHASCMVSSTSGSDAEEDFGNDVDSEVEQQQQQHHHPLAKTAAAVASADHAVVADILSRLQHADQLPPRVESVAYAPSLHATSAAAAAAAAAALSPAMNPTAMLRIGKADLSVAPTSAAAAGVGAYYSTTSSTSPTTSTSSTSTMKVSTGQTATSGSAATMMMPMNAVIV